jgi:hypothetical protein
MRQRSASIAMMLVLTGGLIGIDVRPATALTSIESCFFSAINRERGNVGRPKLVQKDDLTTIARRHSRRMAADHTNYHNKNLGNEIPGKWYAAGENVGMGPDCSSIHDAFMASPGHRANILDRDYNQVGVGVALDEHDTVYVTEDFAGRRSSSRVIRPSVQRRVPGARPAVQKQPTPQPQKAAALAEPRTIAVLLQLLGMDTKRVDTATGQALGV